MKSILILLAFLLLPAPLFAGMLASDDYFQPIPMSEVLRHKDRPGTMIFDLNDQDLWEKHHIKGAVHVVGSDLKSYLPADKSALLIFYCAGPLCRSSADAANRAVVLGFRRVFVMTDGIIPWVKAGHPVESSPASGKVGAPAQMQHGSGHDMQHDSQGGHEMQH
jgi:rhodanese-related sulfurtransferase